MAVVKRKRVSSFIRLFDKTPKGVVCPHFYELILSNGCPYKCAYCYLALTFKGNKDPVLYTNSFEELAFELALAPAGVYSTGELADSLAIIPPLLDPVIDFFSTQDDKYLLLTTKSTNIGILLEREPSPQVIVSFSVNSKLAWERYEHGTPSPYDRLESARRLIEAGWRVRIRIDPIILMEDKLAGYKEICDIVKELNPERITIGSLRHYPDLLNYSPQAPKHGLIRDFDGRLRYAPILRMNIYRTIEEWLGRRPALCKETQAVYDMLGWEFVGCNCSI